MPEFKKIQDLLTTENPTKAVVLDNNNELKLADYAGGGGTQDTVYIDILVSDDYQTFEASYNGNPISAIDCSEFYYNNKKIVGRPVLSEDSENIVYGYFPTAVISLNKEIDSHPIAAIIFSGIVDIDGTNIITATLTGEETSGFLSIHELA